MAPVAAASWPPGRPKVHVVFVVDGSNLLAAAVAAFRVTVSCQMLHSFYYFRIMTLEKMSTSSGI
jgi:hypothetical protein